MVPGMSLRPGNIVSSFQPSSPNSSFSWGKRGLGKGGGEVSTYYDLGGCSWTSFSLLSAGSVVVEHEIILEAKFTPEYKEVLDKVTQQVTEKIENVTKEQISRNNTCESKFLGFWEGHEGVLKESLSFVSSGAGGRR